MDGKPFYYYSERPYTINDAKNWKSRSLASYYEETHGSNLQLLRWGYVRGAHTVCPHCSGPVSRDDPADGQNMG